MERRLKKISKPAKILLLHQKQEVLGSAADLDLEVFNDYDLQEYATFEDLNDIYKFIYEEFKQKFIDAKNNKDIFITDFKCGFTQGGEPIRWKYNDMKKGYKIIEDKKIYFITCLYQKSTIKLDVLYIDDEGRIHEISENYYITIGERSTFNKSTKKEISTNLLIDFKDLFYNKKNYYKALKRLYSYYKINTHNTKIDKLIKFFNSDVGYHSKLISDLKSVILLIEQNFRKVNKAIIYNNIDILYRDKNNEKYKENLKNLLNIFNNLNISQIKDKINEIIYLIEDRINNETLDYINKNDIIKYIR